MYLGNCDDLYQLLEVQHEYSKFVTIRATCNLGTDDDVDYCMNIINCILIYLLMKLMK